MRRTLCWLVLSFPVLVFFFTSCNRPISGLSPSLPNGAPIASDTPTATLNSIVSATATPTAALATSTPTISPTSTPAATSTFTITATIAATLGDSNYSAGATIQSCFITATQFTLTQVSKIYYLDFPINGNALEVGIYPDNGGSPAGQSLLASTTLPTSYYGAFLSVTLAPGNYWFAIVGTGANYTYAFDPASTSPPTIATTTCFSSLPGTFPSSFTTGQQVPIYNIKFWEN